jgi:hypothetical protein
MSLRRLTGAPRSKNGRIEASKASETDSDGRVRYGGPWVSAASALPLMADAMRPLPLARLVAAGVRQPRCAAALIGLLLRTPTEHIDLSRKPAGQALDDYFSQRSLGVIPRKRFCRGVLLLPDDHAAYLRGRRRQALRTNLRRAAAVGIRCEVVRDRGRADEEIVGVLRRQWSSLTDADLQYRLNEVSASLARSDVTLTVARDEHGHPVAMATTLIDDKVGLIKHAVATSHESRWALHDHIVRILIARRVRYLLVDGGGPFGALGFGKNVQQYQRLLGYELRHVVPVRTRRAPRRRRVVASLVVAAATVAAIVPRAVADTVVPAPVERTTSHHAVQSAPVQFVSRASANP